MAMLDWDHKPPHDWERLPNGDVAPLPISLSERYPGEAFAIDELLHWIARDDGTGIYAHHIEWAIDDLIGFVRDSCLVEDYP